MFQVMPEDDKRRKMKIRKAFLLAAGLGTRMRPLTDHVPKPLIEVAGRTMLDGALDKLAEFGVEEVIINVHYNASMIAEHLAKRKDLKIHVSHEAEERLETGGGLRFARELLGNDPIFVISTDVVWEDVRKPALQILCDAWDDKLAGLLLLNKVERGYGYDRKGDFTLLDDGRLEWCEADSCAPYVFTGLQIICPRLFDWPAVREMGSVFSLGKVYSLYLDKFRGVEYDGNWYHIGTPEALEGFRES